MSRKTIVVTESLNQAGIAVLRESAEVVFLDKTKPTTEQHTQLRAADVIISQIYPIDAELIESSPRLVAIGKHGVGVDNIDVEAANRRGIPVLFTPGANARSVAEHTLALILAVARRLPELGDAVRQGDYTIRRDLHLMDLAGTTIAVLGAGNTGQKVLELCCGALGMRGIAYDVEKPEAGTLPDDCRFTSSLEEALRAADIVSVHLPLNDGTRNRIGTAELAIIRPGGILLNVGRGGVVDETALAEALSSGALLGAGVDVFEQEPPAADNPLLHLRNCVVTPHAGGLSRGASETIALMLATDVLAILRGDKPARAINPGIYARPATQSIA